MQRMTMQKATMQTVMMQTVANQIAAHGLDRAAMQRTRRVSVRPFARAWLLGLAVIAALVALAQPASARGRRAWRGDDRMANLGFEAALRTGFAIPYGEAAEGSTLSKLTAGVIPFQLDLGYRVTPHVFGGLLVSAGPALGGDCASGFSCSAAQVRVGGQVHVHLAPRAALDPWIGLGFGYEYLHTKTETTLPFVGTLTSTTNLHGMEFAQLQMGGDLRFGPQLGVGLFVNLSVGQYFSTESRSGDLTQTGDISNRALHGWVTFGARIVMNP